MLCASGFPKTRTAHPGEPLRPGRPQDRAVTRITGIHPRRRPPCCAHPAADLLGRRVGPPPSTADAVAGRRDRPVTRMTLTTERDSTMTTTARRAQSQSQLRPGEAGLSCGHIGCGYVQLRVCRVSPTSTAQTLVRAALHRTHQLAVSDAGALQPVGDPHPWHALFLLRLGHEPLGGLALPCLRIAPGPDQDVRDLAVLVDGPHRYSGTPPTVTGRVRSPLGAGRGPTAAQPVGRPDRTSDTSDNVTAPLRHDRDISRTSR